MSGSAMAASRRAADLGRRFFAWWFGELAALAGHRPGSAAAFRARHLRIDLDGTTARVFDQTRGQARPIGQFRLGDIDASRPLLAAAAARRGGGQVPVLVRLAGARPIEKRLTLPLAAEENLREAASFELDRALPLRAGDLVFGYEVAGRDSAARQVSLRVVAARRDLVAPVLERLATHGIAPSRVELIGEDAPVAACDILPGDAARGMPAGRPRPTIALWTLATGLAVTAAVLPIYRLQREVDALSAQVAGVRAAAADVQRLRAAIAASDQTARFLIERRQAAPRISQVLNDVARILPDDTWLRELRVTGTEVDLAGYSHASATLIGLLDRGGYFHGTEFRSPTMRDSKSGRETFQIATKIREAGK